MSKQSITEISHLYLKHIVNPTDIIIDATMGHGFDTIFLSSLCAKVYAFDIQEDAIASTSNKLKELNIKNVEVTLDSHENYKKYVDKFHGAIFNLGYLPKGDKSITTNAFVTIKTISSMLDHIEPHGFIIIVVYPGHEEGYLESLEINQYLETLNPKQYKILKTELPYQDNKPPYILWITKTKKPS